LSYTVLARRYRSSTFDDVIGQEPIARTLRNAIDSDRTAHAYLFSGTRGVGKTSMARIFARELNTSSELKEKAQIDSAILRGEDLDVIEIDGASNRGVQEARDLIAASGLSPSRCKYRIYIIDEVHMLTTPAFNALLKTMEEPPPHVKFILCTTELHKVPATIQSRCQRFDFRSIPSSKIAEHLEYVLKEEGVIADKEVVAEVARLGNGSMRDALSILDRLLAGGSGTIKLEEMETYLGLPSQKAVTILCSAISRGEMQVAFEAAESLISDGITPDRVLYVVSEALRNALIARVCGGESSLLELSDENIKEAVDIGKELDEATLTHLIALCDSASRQVRRGGSGRAFFEATIARLCMSGQLAEAGSVLSTNTVTKKKRKTEPIKTPPSVSVSETPSKTDKTSNNKKQVDWEVMHNAIASTAGLKQIATHLQLVSFIDSKLILSISDSGRESTNYILAQKPAIEKVVCDVSLKKITLEIKVADKKDDFGDNYSSVDVVEENELVQKARGLFDGTVVQVKNVKKGIN
jgi:DNA polymerase-3 subunit gamma/tau